MPVKFYPITEDAPATVAEPAVAYGNNAANIFADITPSDEWNPNVPFHGTQEEWWEHFHRIEEGNFTPLEEANREFEIWKKNYLASRLK